MVCEEAIWDRASFASFVLRFSAASWVARYHPYRLQTQHRGGMYLADCQWWHYSRDRHGQPVVGCLSTLGEHIQLVLQGHPVLVEEVVAVSPCLQHHLVSVLVVTGRPVIASKRRCVAGWTAAVAPLHRPYCRSSLRGCG